MSGDLMPVECAVRPVSVEAGDGPEGWLLDGGGSGGGTSDGLRYLGSIHLYHCKHDYLIKL